MWPIWEWFVDEKSYAAWIDRSDASYELVVPFGSGPRDTDDGNVLSLQSEPPALAREADKPVNL